MTNKERQPYVETMFECSNLDRAFCDGSKSETVGKYQ